MSRDFLPSQLDPSIVQLRGETADELVLPLSPTRLKSKTVNP